jgi:hypothetical protein
MVRRGACLLLSLSLAVQPGLLLCVESPPNFGLGSAVPITPAAASVSTTADMAVLPGRPPLPVKTVNNPVEDFAAVTLFSLPFTAFWALVGALAIGGISQSRFPPDFDGPLLPSAAAAAAGASVCIGLFSVSWGAGSAPAAPARKAE